MNKFDKIINETGKLFEYNKDITEKDIHEATQRMYDETIVGSVINKAVKVFGSSKSKNQYIKITKLIGELRESLTKDRNESE